MKSVEAVSPATKDTPVNLICRDRNGSILYIGKGLERNKDNWTIQYSYDPEKNARSAMKSIEGLSSERQMVRAVKKIVRGYPSGRGGMYGKNS